MFNFKLGYVLFYRDLQHLWYFLCSYWVLHLHPEVVFELRQALPLPPWAQRTQQDQPVCHRYIQVRKPGQHGSKGHSPFDMNSSSCFLSVSMSTWECAHCTTMNETRAVLCTTCDRPRLATPAVQDGTGSGPTSQNTGERKERDLNKQWLSLLYTDLLKWQDFCILSKHIVILILHRRCCLNLTTKICSPFKLVSVFYSVSAFLW